jgi:hypothetical protein
MSWKSGLGADILGKEGRVAAVTVVFSLKFH